MSTTLARPSAVLGAVTGIVAGAGFITPAHADWPSDPSQNLPIADKTGDQVQPKVRVTADGGAYVGWFDNNAGGYDVYLQRVDAQGNEQWPHDGILVADRGFSSTQDWGMSVDDLGNALLAFRDDRLTGVQITANKVAPDGTLLWGAAGVQLTDTTEFVAAPKITATTDGNVVVAWTQEGSVRLRKLDANGAAVWPDDVVLSDPAGLGASDLHASDAGGAIIAIVKGFFGASLLAQKLSSTGDLLWGESPVVVFDGALQVANFPTFVPDGSGGAVFGWYGVGPLQCYAQRVLADSTEKFTHNGVAGSTTPNNRVGPSVDYNATTGETFLFWTETNASQSQWGVTGQKYDVDGVRQWTNAGRTIVPVGATEITQVRTLAAGDGAMVFWVDKPSPPFGQRVLSSRVDGNGDFTWTPSIGAASSAVAGKSRLDVALTSRDVALLAWSDGRNDGGDIYAQNVNADGSFGARDGDVDRDGNVNFDDLLLVLSNWGDCPVKGECPADLDGDGIVGFSDLLLVLSNWD